MKRFITILLTLCLCLSICGLFIACGGDNSDGGDTNGGGNSFTGEVTEEQWDLAVIAEKFNNVTITYQFTHEQMGEVKCELLIAGDKVLKKMEDPIMNLGYVGENATAQKNLVLDLFIGFIANYEDFTFDQQEGVYCSSATVTTTANDATMGYRVDEEMTNGKIKFADDYSIEWFSCDMTEKVYDENNSLKHSGVYDDMLFTFKDFGTTVVDFQTEVPLIPQETFTEVNEEQWEQSMRISFDCVVKQVLTIMTGEDIYYVTEEEFIRSGNVIKYSDWYISIEGDKYYSYFMEDGVWEREESDEESYIRMATFEELIYSFDKMTFNAQTGLYECAEIAVDDGYYNYYNIKAGFVDGKLAYIYYEELEEGEMKPIYQCYIDYKTVEVSLPTIG